MIRGLESVMLFSGSPKELANFYQDKVGLKIKEEFEAEDGAAGFEMQIGDGGLLYINPSSEVNGKAKDPQRMMLNIEVDDAEKEADRLKSSGVEQIEPVYHMEGYGLISTFADPDGNYFQLAQVRAS
ncbi:MAG: VOC family protein [bacterium]|nr:VOC family protein [bacterium]